MTTTGHGPELDRRLRVARVHFPVTVLGPGERIGIWVQGCTIGCPGCMSTDTWPTDGGGLIDAGELVDALVSRYPTASGVTVSGGEPFEQPDALLDLLREMRRWSNGMERPIDVFVLSGFTERSLRDRFPDHLELIDVIAAGPYVRDRPSPSPLLGSTNKRLVPLSELGLERFRSELGSVLSNLPLVSRRTVQVGVTGGAVSLLGVPEPGTLELLQERLRAAGVIAAETSWEDP